MYFIGLAIGAYSLFIFALGIVGYLTAVPVLIGTLIVVLAILCVVFANKRYICISIPKDRLTLLICFTLCVLAIVNLIGALGPELAFDSLWYHLTIPKLYLANNRIEFISGNLLYYAQLPKMGEMLYIPSLLFLNEIGAKLTHFTFGLLCCLTLFNLSRSFLSKKWSLLVVLVFYSNLVVSWLSITSYVDLTRTFFEILAFSSFFMYFKKGKTKYLILSALLLGFAASVKVVAILTVGLYMVLLKSSHKKQNFLKEAVVFIISFALPLAPYVLVSLFQTGNPFYPFFERMIPNSYSLSHFNPLSILRSILNLFLFSPDPLSPLYAALMPFIILKARLLFREQKILFVVCVVLLVVWYITPFASARFFVPFLPVFSILSVLVISKYMNRTQARIFVFFIFIIALTTIVYRFGANSRYLPYLFGSQTKQEFLLKNLNFSFGDFYDENEEIKKMVGESEVLVLNSHNLYYISFPFAHESWKTRKIYEFVAVQNASLPARYSNYREIYKNLKTRVTLYKSYN